MLPSSCNSSLWRRGQHSAEKIIYPFSWACKKTQWNELLFLKWSYIPWITFVFKLSFMLKENVLNQIFLTRKLRFSFLEFKYMMLQLLGLYMSASYNVRRIANARDDFDALSPWAFKSQYCLNTVLEVLLWLNPSWFLRQLDLQSTWEQGIKRSYLDRGFLSSIVRDKDFIDSLVAAVHIMAQSLGMEPL